MDWVRVLGSVERVARDHLPRDLRDFHWIAYSSQAKAWYGNRDLHYEIWVRHRARVVEVGLHFEADELTNARLLGAFRAHATKVKRALGPDAPIEEWDKGWARVWEPFSLGDEDVAERVRSRFVDYVRVLEPMLRDELPADVKWKLPAERRAKVTSSRVSRSGRR